MQVLENKWKCNACGKKYEEAQAKTIGNSCCGKYMTKILVLVHKP